MDDDRQWIRPREHAWGSEAQRAVLHAVAAEVAERSAHRTAGIEVLRSDGYLEFVAIAGDDVASEQMVGQASPLDLDHIHHFGVELAGWWHVPGARLDEQTRAFLHEYGYRPDAEASDRPGGWDPDDQMLRLLRNEHGELRAILYLDDPLSGLAPTVASATAINAEAGVLFEAIVSTVERELYGEQVRMVDQARRAIESVPPGLAVADLLDALSVAMTKMLDVASVDVIPAGSDVPGIELERAQVTELMREQWARRGHVVVERDRTWSMQEGAIKTPPSLTRLLDVHGLGSGLLVPIGAGDEYLGTLAMGRAAEQPRWIASEINAATTVAADLARLVLVARLMERERALTSQFRELNDYRRDMMTTLAHELRNPVTILFANLDVLAQESGDSPGDVLDSIQALDRAARRIDTMVSDLMTLAAADGSHEKTILVDAVDLSAAVREVSEFLEPLATGAGVDLDVDVRGEFVLRGDQVAIERAVSNLLANAIKYTPHGGRVDLTVAPEPRDGVDGVAITCADTGIGIAPVELDKVFVPFFRSKDPAARTRPGTGLGLAIVDRVVNRHGGTAHVDSVLGEGTTFTVWLPMRRDSR